MKFYPTRELCVQTANGKINNLIWTLGQQKLAG